MSRRHELVRGGQGRPAPQTPIEWFGAALWLVPTVVLFAVLVQQFV